MKCDLCKEEMSNKSVQTAFQKRTATTALIEAVKMSCDHKHYMYCVKFREPIEIHHSNLVADITLALGKSDADFTYELDDATYTPDEWQRVLKLKAFL